jgi:signal transduction histidine kinase/CheY-like chemotaxis protein
MLLQKDKAIAELGLHRQKLLRNVLIAGVLLLTGILLLVYRSYRMGARIRHQIEEHNRELESLSAKLRASERRYRQLFDEPSSPKLVLDPDNRTIIDANVAAASWWPDLPQGGQGATLAELGLGWLDAALERIPLQLEEVRTVDGEWSHHNGRRDLQAWITSVELQQGAALYVVLHDITDLRRLDAERAKLDKLQSLGVLAGGIAHDFNNIMAAILGNASLAGLRMKPEDPVRRQLDAIESAVMRARRLTGQLLALARGGEPIRKISNLEPLLREQASFCLSGSSSRCVFDIAADLWPAEVDEGQLTQVITNLVVNADQAMSSHGMITISAVNREVAEGDGLPLTPGPYVLITVADQGPGIAPEIVDRVFDPYFTTKNGGIGLGLAVAHAVIRRHKGHIALAPQSSNGATFEVLLPATPHAQLEAELGFEAPVPGRGRVLAMDDEPQLRTLYRELLTSLGYDTEVVSNGQEAIEAYRKAHDLGQPFDAVIMDLTVPGGMGGREALAEILAVDPDALAIVASGYSADPVLSRFQEAGFSGALAKPFSASQLSQVLARALASR